MFRINAERGLSSRGHTNARFIYFQFAESLAQIFRRGWKILFNANGRVVGAYQARIRSVREDLRVWMRHGDLWSGWLVIKDRPVVIIKGGWVMRWWYVRGIDVASVAERTKIGDHSRGFTDQIRWTRERVWKRAL